MAAGYYVSIVRGGESRLLLGPYSTKRQAELNVENGRQQALAYSDRHWWDAFGTCKVTADKLPRSIFSVNSQLVG